MKLQINDTAKTIKIEGEVNIGEFIEKISKLIPEWKEYTLLTNTIINNWSTPIMVQGDWVAPPTDQPYRPWHEPPYIVNCNKTSVASGGQFTNLKVFNVEL